MPRRPREFRYTPTVSAGPSGFADEEYRTAWLNEGRSYPPDNYPRGEGFRDGAPDRGGRPPGNTLRGGLPPEREPGRIAFGEPGPARSGPADDMRPEDYLQGSPGYEFGPGTGPMRMLQSRGVDGAAPPREAPPGQQADPWAGQRTWRETGPFPGTGPNQAGPNQAGPSRRDAPGRDAPGRAGPGRDAPGQAGPGQAGPGGPLRPAATGPRADGAGTRVTNRARAPLALPPAAGDAQTTGQRLLQEIREALKLRGWVLKVGVPILAMIPVGIAVVILAGANASNTTTPTPSTTSLGFPPANFATADFTTSAGQAGRGLSQTLGAVASNANGNGNGNEIVAIGAQTGTEVSRADFFVSRNSGNTWKLASTQGPGGVNPAPGHAPTLIAAGPGGWVAVGPDSIWTSQNGTTWTLDSTTGLPTQAGDQITALTRTANGFLAAGENGTTPVIWLSSNGVSWQRAQPVIAQAKNIKFAAAAGGAIVISGDLTTGGSGVWRSTDGASWTPVTVPRTGGAKNAIAGLAPLGNGFVAVRPATKTSRAEIYTSLTGQQWARSAQLMTTDGARLTLGPVSGGTTGAVVSGEADGFLFAFISANGTNWTGTDSFGTVRAETQTGIALTGGNVAVTTGTSGLVNARRTPMLALVGTAGAARQVTLASPVRHQLQINAVAAAGGTQVAAGSADGFPAIWVSADGGASWKRVASAALARAGAQRLISVVHGNAGWVAVGAVVAGAAARPVVVTSPDGATWTTADNEAAFAGAGLSATSVTAGTDGYVITGEQQGSAIAWFSTGLTGWQRVTLPGAAGTYIKAVAASARGFVAVGTSGTTSKAWISPNGASWALATIPLPGGAARAGLSLVAANGNRVVAAGIEVTAAGQSTPFAVTSANAGADWVDAALPVMSGEGLVTALTAAGSGFTAVGASGESPGNLDVVIWTSQTGTTWTEARPAGRGLQGAGIQEITALTAADNELTGIGFVATATSEEPTIWQSPVRG